MGIIDRTLPHPTKPELSASLSPGLDIDGLYRISGNLATIQKLRYKVDHGEPVPIPRPRASKARKDADLLFLLLSPPPPPPPPLLQMSASTWTTGAGRTSTLLPVP